MRLHLGSEGLGDQVGGGEAVRGLPQSARDVDEIRRGLDVTPETGGGVGGLRMPSSPDATAAAKALSSPSHRLRWMGQQDPTSASCGLAMKVTVRPWATVGSFAQCSMTTCRSAMADASVPVNQKYSSSEAPMTR